MKNYISNCMNGLGFVMMIMFLTMPLLLLCHFCGYIMFWVWLSIALAVFLLGGPFKGYPVSDEEPFYHEK